MDLATENFHYAEKIARAYCRSNSIFSDDLKEDVVGWGMIGLVNASKKWDGSGTFHGYAYLYIINAIRDGLRSFFGRRGQKIHVLEELSQTPYFESLFDVVDDMDMIERISKVLTSQQFDFAIVAEFSDSKAEIARQWGVTPGRISQVRKGKAVQSILAPHIGQ